MIYSTWKNLAAATMRNMRLVVFCAFILVLSAVALGVKFSLLHNSATAAATMNYDVLKRSRHDESIQRNEFRQALKRLVRRKDDALSAMRGRDIRLVFGNPQQVRRDAHVHVWQYRTDDCLIDIYMRETSGNNTKLQAAHHDMRERRLIKVNGRGGAGDARNDFSDMQRSTCLTTAFRNYDPEEGGQSYASLE